MSCHAKKFIIGVEAISYYPLFDFEANNVARPSFARELLVTFFERYHYDYQLLALPIKRFDKWFVEQHIDFKFPDNERWRTDQRDKLPIVFSDPVVTLMAGSFVLKSRRDITRQQVKKLGTIFGFYPTLWFDRIEQQQTVLVEEYEPIGIIRHLLYGNVDATNIDLNVINYNLQRLNRPGEVVLSANMPHETFDYHLSTINHPEVIVQFNQFLHDEQAFITQLKRKYKINENFDFRL